MGVGDHTSRTASRGRGGAVPSHGLIVGHGRSGSNWLLSMLNASRTTHCRNEPHQLAGSPYRNLPLARDMVHDHASTNEVWTVFVNWACAREGVRDPKTAVVKVFHRNHFTRLLMNLPLRPRLRRLAALALPRLRGEEWTPLGAVVDRSALYNAFHVLKLNDMRFWHIRDVLRAGTPTVHLVRHPGGQLLSGWRRFFSTLSDGERSAELRLHRLALEDSRLVSPRWRSSIPDVDELTLAEAVLWFWRVNNEEIFLAGRDMPNYKLIRYEDVISDPLGAARIIYTHFDVPWDDRVERVITDGLQESVWGPVRTTSRRRLAYGWREELDGATLELVEQMLQGPPVASWW